MLLYRLGGDFKNIEHSHSVGHIADSRLDMGAVDRDSIDSLVRLVAGGLSRVGELYAAEMALRGIVFHESVEEFAPSVKVQMIHGGADPLILNVSPDTEDRKILQSVFDAIGFKTTLCGVDQVLGFRTQEEADQWIEAHEKRRRKREEEKEAERKRRGGKKPVIDLDPEAVPIEHVADDKGTYFSKLFQEDIGFSKRFLRPITSEGFPPYIGNPVLRSWCDGIRQKWDAREFFDVLDSDWQGVMTKLRRPLDIPIPLIVSVVLSRANDRNSIPREIINLRDEFEEARGQLWSLFDELELRSDSDPSLVVRNLEEIENEAAKVVPQWKDRGAFSFPMRFDAIGRLAELNVVGIVKDVGAFVRDKLLFRGVRVDAAHLLSKSMEDVQVRGLLERHLTERELELLDRDANWK